MKIPFTVEQFMDVFKNYNNAVFPMQIVLYLFALAAIYSTFKKISWSDKIISSILSFFWLWMGIVYQLIFFTTINKTAYLFGTLFILQSGLFLWKGVFQNKLSFRFRKDIYGIAGIALLVFALAIYPLIGYLLGHVYPALPTFGLPCPTTIFTFGMLLMVDKKYPPIILFIPMIWGIIGFLAAFLLGIKEDIGLLISAFLSTGLLIKRNRKASTETKVLHT